jgi:hypothetical protein
MTLIADKPGQSIAFEAPEAAASYESRNLRQRRFADMLDTQNALARNQAISANIHPLTSDAYSVANILWSPAANEAKEILKRLARAVPFESASIEVPIHFALLDDGSVVLEWIRRDRRLGFSLEPDSGSSGWFYVFSAGSSTRSEAGTMDQLEMERLIKMMTQQ